jgi:hypothetical protein
MKVKLLIILLVILIGIFLPVVLAEEFKESPITEDNQQFVVVPSDRSVTYLSQISDNVPANGILLLTISENKTYMIDDGSNVKFITIMKALKTESIIDILLGWL